MSTADLRERIQQFAVASGGCDAGLDLAAQVAEPEPGLSVAVVAQGHLHALDRLPRRLPAAEVVGHLQGLVVQQRRLVQRQLDLGCSGLTLVEVGRGRQTADGRQGQDRGGKARLESPPPPFLDRMRLRLLRQRVSQNPPFGLFLGPRCASTRASSAVRSRSCTPAR